MSEFVLSLTQEEFTQLDRLIGEVPTKVGLPIVQFFQLVQQKRQVEKQQEEIKKQSEETKKELQKVKEETAFVKGKIEK